MSGNHTRFRSVTDKQLERVLLVSLALGGREVSNSDTEEMIRLVESAGGIVESRISQRRNRPDPAFLIGKGKAAEVAHEAKTSDISTIVIDHDLSPGQVNRLEEITSCKVIDRTELILAIFAVQARTPQAKLRIELAQLRYMLPRLSGLWHHLDRLGAGIGTRGPGETQLEVDRRRARSRIASLEAKLETIDSSSKVRRSRRKNMYTIAIAGYTNAGKSTLLNTLCDAEIRSEDRLFATLDTTSRRLSLPGGESVLISDTVGFIQDLPDMLLSSFRSTLDVVSEADLILLVADCSDPDRVSRVATVSSTLNEIGAGEIPKLLVWNKSDLNPKAVQEGIQVSALTGRGMDSLLDAVQAERRKALDWWLVKVDICTGEVENWIRSSSIVDRISRFPEGGAEIHCGFYLGRDSAEKFLSSQGVSFSFERSMAYSEDRKEG